MLIYLSCSGNSVLKVNNVEMNLIHSIKIFSHLLVVLPGGFSTGLQVESSGGFKRPSNIEVAGQAPYKQNPADDWGKGYLSSCYENSLSLGPQATEGWQ